MRETLKERMNGVAYVGKPKLIANNTVRYMREDGSEVVRLHHTDVVIKRPDGTYELNTGGWKTSTTKDRINCYSPARVYSKSGTWYLAADVPFYDGVVIGPNGELPKAKPAIATKEQALRKQIRTFVGRLDKMECLPEPGPGDCWYCSMFQREPVRNGEDKHGYAGMTKTGPMEDNEHIHSHIEEGYMHGSLIMNALTWAGYRDPSLIWHMENNNRKSGRKPDMVKRAMRRYLYRKLGMQA
jgi:hypothetical protein